MQPMAIPSVGGMSIQLITLFIAPCLYCFVQEIKFRRHRSTRPGLFGENSA
jgi:Cu(I)/Ag(I) efflux system membrane protein CusA/SilA